MTQKSKPILELQISEPYFLLLSNQKTQKSLRKLFIKLAPKEFYSVLTQLSRHFLNNTPILNDTKFVDKYEASIYLLAIPSTSKLEKQKILEKESVEFYKHLSNIVKEILNDGC